MKICGHCHSANAVSAKFCSECGSSLAKAVPQIEGGGSSAAHSGLLNFEAVIEHARRQIKEMKEVIPNASSPAIGALIGSLQSIPPEVQLARIAVIQALGETRDPAVLRALLLVTGASSKDVRKAVAIALSRIQHSLSAYLLLPMLLDGSSRVRNAAIQSLIHICQPHCAEVIVAAGLKSPTFRRITSDTIKVMAERQRIRLGGFLSQIACGDDSRVVALVGELQQLCGSPQVHAATSQPRASRSGSENAGYDDPRHRPERLTPEQPIHAATMTESNVSLEFDAMSLMSTADTEIDQGQLSLAGLFEGTQENPASQNGMDQALGSNDSFADFNFFESVSAQHDAPQVISRDEGQFVNEFEYGVPPLASHSNTLSGGNVTTSSSEIEMVSASQSAVSSRAVPGVSPSPLPEPTNRMPFPAERGWQTSRSGLGFEQAANTGYGSAVTPMPQPGDSHLTPHSGVHQVFSQPVPGTPTFAPPGNGHPGIPNHGRQMDLTASSPLIQAFTVPSQPAMHRTGHNSAPNAPIVAGATLSAADGQSGTTRATTLTSSAASGVTLAAERNPHEEEEASKISQSKETSERNLRRLREERDAAFRRILEARDEIVGTPARLLSRKIVALQATPATDLEKIRKLLIDLGRSGSPGAIESINAFCHKPAREIRIACAEALGKIVHQGSAVPLLQFLSDKSGTVVETAVTSLISINQDVVRNVVLAAALVTGSLRTVVTSGIESVPEDQKSGWEQFLLSVMKTRDLEMAAFAVSLLSRITGATHCEIYQKLVKHESGSLRAAAVDALTRTGEKRVIGCINEALSDPDPMVRGQAALAIATIHSPRSVELLGHLLSDPDVTVRRNAAQSASRIEEDDLGDAITKALDVETDAITVESLLGALNRNGGKSALSILIRYIEVESGQFRELALKALRKLKIPESAPVFRRLLNDFQPSIRRQSVEQLAVLKVEAVVPRLREMLKKDTDESVRSACAKALGEFQDKASLSLLEEALEDHPVVRLQAVIAIGRFGMPSAGPALLSLLTDTSPEVRYQAVRAVGQMKLEGAEDYAERLMDDPDEMVRRGAELTLQEYGFSRARIRRRRFARKLTSLSAKLMPSSVAGAIPGGVKTLLSVMVLCGSVGGYWIFTGVNFEFQGGEQLRVGWVVALDVNATTKTAAALREYGVLDIWSVADEKLVTRVAVPDSATGVLIEPKGGVVLLMGKEIGRLDPETGYDSEKMVRVELTHVPSTVAFHEASGSLCVFETDGTKTTLRVLDTVTLQESRKFEIPAAFRGSCIVSPDFSIAIMLEPGGDLTLADLKEGGVVSASVSNLTGQGNLGNIYSVTFTGDMKHVAFSSTTGCTILDVGNLTLVKSIPSPDAYGFVAAKPVGKGSNLVVLSASGSVFNVTDEFKTVVESRIERDESFDVSAFSAGGELVAVANTEGFDFDVYSVGEKQIVMKSTQ